jgi:hypothetical protein
MKKEDESGREGEEEGDELKEGAHEIVKGDDEER